MLDDFQNYYVQGRRSLSTNKPGASARAKAQELRRQAPIKSVLADILGVHREDQDWVRGSQGEERVSKLLEPLKTQGWHLFNDITIGSRGANIDHLLVGPPGVFCINTKNLSGNVWVARRAFWVNGYKTGYLPKARREGERVGECLRRALGYVVPVQPVLAVMSRQIKIKEQPADARVTTSLGCRLWLESLPARIDEKGVFAIARVADDPATWSPARPRS